MHSGNGTDKYEISCCKSAGHEGEGLLVEYSKANLGISKYAHCSNASYVIALIYLDRLQEEREDLILNQYCVHKYVNSNFRLLISAIVLAAKYNDDEFYKNVYYAKVGGITLAEMNTLEALFAELLDYKFFVQTEDFNKYLLKLA